MHTEWSSVNSSLHRVLAVPQGILLYYIHISQSHCYSVHFCSVFLPEHGQISLLIPPCTDKWPPLFRRMCSCQLTDFIHPCTYSICPNLSMWINSQHMSVCLPVVMQIWVQFALVYANRQHLQYSLLQAQLDNYCMKVCSPVQVVIIGHICMNFSCYFRVHLKCAVGLRLNGYILICALITCTYVIRWN